MVLSGSEWGELLVVGWRICGVPSEREGEVIGSQGFTLGWYAVPRWGTQNETSIDGCMQ